MVACHLIVMTSRRMSRAAVYTDYCTRYVWRSRSILSTLRFRMISRSQVLVVSLIRLQAALSRNTKTPTTFLLTSSVLLEPLESIYTFTAVIPISRNLFASIISIRCAVSMSLASASLDFPL